jgi:hypothetical protein
MVHDQGDTATTPSLQIVRQASCAGHGPTSPRYSSNVEEVSPQGSNGTPTRHVDAIRLRREARELSDLAKLIPVDIEHVVQGLLPKITTEKQKPIEKISKHLRCQLTR